MTREMGSTWGSTAPLVAPLVVKSPPPQGARFNPTEPEPAAVASRARSPCRHGRCLANRRPARRGRGAGSLAGISGSAMDGLRLTEESVQDVPGEHASLLLETRVGTSRHMATCRSGFTSQPTNSSRSSRPPMPSRCPQMRPPAGPSRDPGAGGGEIVGAVGDVLGDRPMPRGTAAAVHVDAVDVAAARDEGLHGRRPRMLPPAGRRSAARPQWNRRRRGSRACPRGSPHARPRRTGGSPRPRSSRVLCQ